MLNLTHEKVYAKLMQDCAKLALFAQQHPFDDLQEVTFRVISSLRFAQPDWQSSEVSSYFSSGVDLPDSKYYNASGRGYPDVSALAGQVNAYFISYKVPN